MGIKLSIIIMISTMIAVGNLFADEIPQSCLLSNKAAIVFQAIMGSADQVKYINKGGYQELQSPYLITRMGNSNLYKVSDSSDESIDCIFPERTVLISGDEIIVASDLLEQIF